MANYQLMFIVTMTRFNKYITNKDRPREAASLSQVLNKPEHLRVTLYYVINSSRKRAV
jgi:hypothetical protein